MVNKPKPQNLSAQIEKFSDSAELDSDWQPHFNEVMKTLGSIEPIEPFSLLDAESARLAAKACGARLEKLDQIMKQIKAVNALMHQEKANAKLEIDNLPWPKAGKATDS